MPERNGRFYCFGPFRLDVEECRLLRGDEVVPLNPKAFDTLVVLVRRSGHLVKKDELLGEVWPEAYVEDSNLAHQISSLRKALGETREGTPYVETVPRRGYRFTAPVVELGEDGRLESAPRRLRRWALMVASVALVAVGSLLVGQRLTPRPSPTGERIMLAVLPFENLSGDPDQEYLSDGLTEEMITQLGSLDPEQLGVIARTSSMLYKGGRKGIDAVGRELGVDYVLEGSVRRDAGRVRISAQLIRVRDQSHLWAKSYDRGLGDLLVLQDDVAQSVARQIVTELAPDERARVRWGPVDAEAHEHYLRGRFYWNKRTPEGLCRGRELFEQALDEDPLYARAYSGLADSYTNLTWYGILPPREAMPRARAAALKAIEIDDELAEGHASLGMVAFYYDWDWAKAEAELKRAVRLNPGYSTGRYWHACFLAGTGQGEESVREMREALAVDPLSVRTRCDLGWTLFLARRYEEAIDQLRGTLEMDPDFAMAHHILGETYAASGRFEEAVAALQRARDLSPKLHFRALLGYAHARAGREEEARKILDELKRTPERWSNSLEFATLCGVLGEKDEAFRWLERAFEDRLPRLARLAVEPWWDPLRGDPRFDDLLRRMNLPPS